MIVIGIFGDWIGKYFRKKHQWWSLSWTLLAMCIHFLKYSFEYQLRLIGLPPTLSKKSLLTFYNYCIINV